MKLDLKRLTKVRQRGDKIAAACPACREAERDTDGDNLVIFSDGRFACAANQGDAEHSRRILALAGTNEGRTTPTFPGPSLPSQGPSTALNWDEECGRRKPAPALLERVANWRGYPQDYVTILSNLGVFAFHDGRICFPVRRDAGRGDVVGRHVFSWPQERTGTSPKSDAWYNPAGEKPLPPLIFGWGGIPSGACVMESQWDALSVLSALKWEGGTRDRPFLCTRGTSPTPALSEALEGVATVWLWMQRDEPKADASIPSEQWLARSVDLLPDSVTKIFRIDPPQGFKDWNDAQRAMQPNEFACAVKAARQSAVEVFRPAEASPIHISTADWPIPTPLPTAPPAVPPFDSGKLLPSTLRTYVTDCAERLQVDASFVAVPLIVSLGSVLGNRIGLRPGYLIRLRVNGDLAAPAYLSYSLRSPATRSTIELTARSTSGVNNLNTDEIKALAINVPPLPEQHEIVRRLQAAMARLDAVTAAHGEAVAELDRLEQSLLAKAFRGELVPQDLNDEPAAQMLERLRTQLPQAAPPRTIKAGRRSREDVEQAPRVAVLERRVAATPALSWPTPTVPPPAPREESAPCIDELDKNDLMARLREVLHEHGPCDRETAIKQTAYSLGYQRAGRSIAEEIDNVIRTAMRRYVLVKVNGELRATAPASATWRRTTATS